MLIALSAALQSIFFAGQRAQSFSKQQTSTLQLSSNRTGKLFFCSFSRNFIKLYQFVHPICLVTAEATAQPSLHFSVWELP